MFLGRIFSPVRRAVSNLDRSMNISLWIQFTHSSFTEGSHTTKNTACANRVNIAGQPNIPKLIRILLKFQKSAINRSLRSRLNSFFVWLLFQFFITNPNICVKNVNTPCLYYLFNLSLLHPLTHNAWTACRILMPKMFFSCFTKMHQLTQF